MDNGISKKTGNDEEDVRNFVSGIAEKCVPAGQGEKNHERRPSDDGKSRLIDECMAEAEEIYNEVIKTCEPKIVKLSEKLKRLALMHGKQAVVQFFNRLCELILVGVITLAAIILLTVLSVAILACAGYYLLPIAIECITTHIISHMITVAKLSIAQAECSFTVKMGLQILLHAFVTA